MIVYELHNLLLICFLSMLQLVLIQGGLTYDEMAKQMGFERIVSVDEELQKYSMKHPYEVLVKSVVPEGVDIVNKEVK